MTPQEYAQRFVNRESYPAGLPPLTGVCGRFIRGVKPEDFDKLSDEPGKVFSWICTPEILAPLLGCSPSEAMVRHVGFTTSWLRARLSDGTSHKLVLFPETETQLATWDNLMTAIKEHYGEDIYDLLAPHLPEMKTKSWVDIDPEGRFRKVADLPVVEKHAHADFTGPDRLRQCKPVRLVDARAFFSHSIGCNRHFIGTGFSPQGMPEAFTLNRELKDIPGVVVVDLEVTESDVEKEELHEGL